MSEVHHNHGYHHRENGHQIALNPAQHPIKEYIPLIVVFAFILIATSVHISVVGSSIQQWMMISMGYFFLFFALFKFIDISGFKEGFAHYDIIAQRLPLWGYIYPLVELTLAIFYLLNLPGIGLYMTTIVVALLNVVSVAIKLARKEQFMCACLGTVLKVPLTTVTLIEYGMMGLMALWMLIRAI